MVVMLMKDLSRLDLARSHDFCDDDDGFMMMVLG